MEVEYVNVKADPEGMERMLSLNPARQVPVIVENPGGEKKVITGFGGT